MFVGTMKGENLNYGVYTPWIHWVGGLEHLKIETRLIDS
jgi:hypothetical protein